MSLEPWNAMCLGNLFLMVRYWSWYVIGGLSELFPRRRGELKNDIWSFLLP